MVPAHNGVLLTSRVYIAKCSVLEVGWNKSRKCVDGEDGLVELSIRGAPRSQRSKYVLIAVGWRKVQKV